MSLSSFGSSFLHFFTATNTVVKDVAAVASAPGVSQLIGLIPVAGAPIQNAIGIITALESITGGAPGLGAAKAAVAVPSIHALMPGATQASVAQLVADLVKALNAFNAANPTPPPILAP